MQMTLKKAVGLAVKSMQKELQRFAFDATMYREYGLDYAHAKRAAAHVEELKDAQGLLLALAREGTKGTEGDAGAVIWLTEGNAVKSEAGEDDVSEMVVAEGVIVGTGPLDSWDKVSAVDLGELMKGAGEGLTDGDEG